MGLHLCTNCMETGGSVHVPMNEDPNKELKQVHIIITNIMKSMSCYEEEQQEQMSAWDDSLST